VATYYREKEVRDCTCGGCEAGDPDPRCPYREDRAKVDSFGIDQPWFVAVAAHTWGRGHTPTEAVAQLRKAGYIGRAKRTKLVRVLALPRGANNPSVDGMGSVGWTWSVDIPKGDRTGRGTWGPYEGEVSE
jgi:hypothetical protein